MSSPTAIIPQKIAPIASSEKFTTQGSTKAKFENGVLTISGAANKDETVIVRDSIDDKNNRRFVTISLLDKKTNQESELIKVPNLDEKRVRNLRDIKFVDTLNVRFEDFHTILGSITINNQPLSEKPENDTKPSTIELVNSNLAFYGTDDFTKKFTVKFAEGHQNDRFMMRNSIIPGNTELNADDGYDVFDYSWNQEPLTQDFEFHAMKNDKRNIQTKGFEKFETSP